MPGGVQVISEDKTGFGLAADASDADRRRRLAEWVASDRNPLLARVMANRVWYHHFGVGLIETPNDFGFNGGQPSNPELLEFLASEFARGGFRLKPDQVGRDTGILRPISRGRNAQLQFWH